MGELSEVFEVGGLSVAALSDGRFLTDPKRLFQGADPASWVSELNLSSADEQIPYNLGTFLVRGDGHTTLVDAGFGTRTRGVDGVTGGSQLLARLSELGVERTDVDRVLLTHLHQDHCGWLVNDDDAGALTFSAATVYLNQIELDFWLSQAADDPHAEYARSRIGPVQLAQQLEPFSGEFEVSEALTFIPTPGHTPGHSAVMLASQGEHLLITGDVANHPAHLIHHDWFFFADMDRAGARASRAKLAALAVERDALVTGGHWPIPTIGKLHALGEGYRWEMLATPDATGSAHPTH
jgi:glyoxylase-like metal-dependent hydrolase (beta-lactamase superfamily II)